ncbi:recombination protein O N-terminal domain-containing protein [Elstera litoralis]|uniref:recombination protein O N-terminal domain-containing protein n=1 Tax=Elstera litoralis TaxID=552518 RepID=UPI00069775AB|nr:recombination protein O N-terminal domain-containing protein [Elstera litoralis]
MRWRDQGYILSLRPQGESGMVVSLLTDSYGRHLGFHRGSPAKLPWRQPGTRVVAAWNSRMDSGLGYWALEPEETPALRYFGQAPKLLALASAMALIDALLPERMPVPEVFAACAYFLAGLDGNDWLERYGVFGRSLVAGSGGAPRPYFRRGGGPAAPHHAGTDRNRADLGAPAADGARAVAGGNPAALGKPRAA